MKIVLSVFCSAILLAGLYKLLFLDVDHFREEARGWSNMISGPFRTGFTGIRFAIWLVIGIGGGVFAGIKLYELLIGV